MPELQYLKNGSIMTCYLVQYGKVMVVDTSVNIFACWIES